MDSELYRAAVSGNIEFLLQNTEKVGDQMTQSNNSVLHLSSQLGKTECVKQVLQLHPNLLCKLNSTGETALHLAAREGRTDVVQALIDEAKRSDEQQILQSDEENGGVGSSLATRHSIKETMIRMVNNNQDTALHEAARFNQVEVVKLLVQEDMKDSHTANKDGETPLYIATYCGYNDVVSLLCETCVSPAYGGPDGRNALHASIISYKYGSFYKLVSWKPELVREVDKHGWTALHYAAFYDLHNYITGLLEVDKFVAYIADYNGKRTALHIAAIRNSIDAMKEIMKLCPDCYTMVDERSRNVLHIAVEKGNKEVCAYIVQNCAEISTLLGQKDEDGNTPLHLVAISGCFVPEIINHPVTYREARNKKNLTPQDEVYSVPDVVADQREVSDALIKTSANRTWNLWRVIKGETEFQDKREETKIKSMMETHMIVAALIATITFAAGFAIPGGYNGNEGPKQGMAILSRDAAFQTFIVADTIGLVSSMTSLVMYFVAAVQKDIERVALLLILSFYLNIISIVATVLAFTTGTYAMFHHPSALAIALCVIGCSFFLFLYFILRKTVRQKQVIYLY